MSWTQHVTEAEWLACEQPRSMLEFVWNRPSDRKLRLFACACCRRATAHPAIEIAEAYADGQLSQQELWDFRASAGYAFGPVTADWAATSAALSTLGDYPSAAARDAAQDAALYRQLVAEEHGDIHVASREAGSKARRIEESVQCQLLRDILGSPFRPVKAASAWFTVAVVGQAQDIYERRAFDRMSILGNALEDAGCTDVEILDHCRKPGEHVRGCWLLDAVLGKS